MAISYMYVRPGGHRRDEMSGTSIPRVLAQDKTKGQFERPKAEPSTASRVEQPPDIARRSIEKRACAHVSATSAQDMPHAVPGWRGITTVQMSLQSSLATAWRRPVPPIPSATSSSILHPQARAKAKAKKRDEKEKKDSACGTPFLSAHHRPCHPTRSNPEARPISAWPLAASVAVAVAPPSTWIPGPSSRAV